MKYNSISNPWIPVDRRVNKPREEKLSNGVTIKFVLTHENVPTAVRLYLSKEKSCFVLEFRYFGSEQTESHDVEQGIVVEIGKQTGRLFRVLVPQRLVDESTREGIAIDLSSSLKSFVDHAFSEMQIRSEFRTWGLRKEYCAIASEVVNQERSNLFAFA